MAKTAFLQDKEGGFSVATPALNTQGRALTNHFVKKAEQYEIKLPFEGV